MTYKEMIVKLTILNLKTKLPAVDVRLDARGMETVSGIGCTARHHALAQI